MPNEPQKTNIVSEARERLSKLPSLEWVRSGSIVSDHIEIDLRLDEDGDNWITMKGDKDETVEAIAALVGAAPELLRQLADEVEELRRRNDTQSESIMELQAEEKSLTAQLAQAHADNERLALVIQGIEKREAAVCPEDVGFDEYIRTLQKKLETRPRAGYPWTGNEP